MYLSQIQKKHPLEKKESSYTVEHKAKLKNNSKMMKAYLKAAIESTSAIRSSLMA